MIYEYIHCYSYKVICEMAFLQLFLLKKLFYFWIVK